MAHIKVLSSFDIIGLYNKWVEKIDETFGSNWAESAFYIKKSPDYIYSGFARALQKIIDNNNSRFI